MSQSTGFSQSRYICSSCGAYIRDCDLVWSTGFLVNHPYHKSCLEAKMGIRIRTEAPGCEHCNYSGEGQRWNPETKMMETVPGGCPKCGNG